MLAGRKPSASSKAFATTDSSNSELGDFCDNIILPLQGLQKLDIQVQVARFKHEYHLAYFDARESIPKRK